MKCFVCGSSMEDGYVCPKCGSLNPVAKKIIYSSNWHYNRGLASANIRDLSGAAQSLRTALSYNKKNTKARNLLGLVYFQMGEIVDALSEWVISIHFQREGNEAVRYLKTMQDNPALFQEAGKVIAKYNKALSYIRAGNSDMAMLELRRAVSLNPKYVRAYQLLALLYMQRGQYAGARRALTKAVKIDRNNLTTMRYLKEVNQHYKKPNKEAQTSSGIRISDPTPIIIEKKEEKGYSEYNTGFISFINILIGIVIGAAVIWLLIVPSITKSKESAYNDAVVTYSAQLSERNKEISSLKAQVESLQKTVSEYESRVGATVDDAGESRKNLEKAILNYLEDDDSTAGRLVSQIDPAAITDDMEKDIYNALRLATRASITPTLYANAELAYENGNYTEAIDGFSKVLRMDTSYASAVYYLARSYHRAGDLVNAAAYYQQVVQNYSESEYAEDAYKYLDQIDRTAGSSVLEAATRANEERESRARAETETEETETSYDDYGNGSGQGGYSGYNDGGEDSGSGDGDYSGDNGDGSYDGGDYSDGNYDGGDYSDGNYDGGGDNEYNDDGGDYGSDGNYDQGY